MVREEVLLEVLHVHFHLEVRGGDQLDGPASVAVYITSADDGPGGAFPGALPRWRRLRGACVSYMGTNHTL